MGFKSVEDMRRKAIRNRNLMTLEQSKWIDEFKAKIINELDRVYNESPYIGFVSVYMSIDQGIISNSDVEKYSKEINSIKIDLIRLGYIVNIEFSYDRVSKLADSCYMNIKWEI